MVLVAGARSSGENPHRLRPECNRRALAQLHAALQVAFGWSDEHLYVFQIRGWQFGDPPRAIELALAAFAFEVNETFH
jgi:hypothetical protein